MKFVAGLIATLSLVALASSARAQLVNLAVTEHATVTDIFGYNNGADLSTLGVAYEEYGNSRFTLNDNNTSQDNDNTTFGNQGGRTGTSYGYGGYTNLVVPLGLGVTSVNLFMNLYGDGGWYGPNADFSAQSPLSAADLSVPLIQVTTNNGSSWSTVSASSNNYLAVLESRSAGSGGTPQITFTLDAPATNIDGIRVIGLNGGYAGPGGDNATSGFSAINELQIEAGVVPEPSTWALMVAGAGLLFIASRRRFMTSRD